jgi:hypothetical protein
MPIAEACQKLGHIRAVHLGLYAHVALDRTEVDYETLVVREVIELTPPTA